MALGQANDDSISNRLGVVLVMEEVHEGDDHAR